MLNLETQVLNSFATISISTFIISYFILNAIIKSNKNFLSFLHVKADKSPTNASLLGGLPLSILSLASVAISLFFYAEHFSQNEIFILKCSFAPIFIITFYGYLDDKYEIRARHKLLLQVISISSFVIPVCLNQYQDKIIPIALLLTFGLAYINGSNLIDGLDTIFAKLGAAISIAFLVISFEMMSLPSAIFSVLMFSSMFAFYFFNKEPAKIYAGEIGGSLLGVLMFIQGNFLIEKYIATSQDTNLHRIVAKILILSIYPLSELGITFSRRIYFKQSPFRGDHLHLHHIIKTKFKFSASKTANVISLIYIATALVGYGLLQLTTPIVAGACSIAFISLIYSSICYPYWKKTYTQINSSKMFMSINEKHIYVIDGKEIEALYAYYHHRDDQKPEKTSSQEIIA